MALTMLAMTALLAVPDAGAEEVPLAAKMEGFFGFVEWVLDTSLTDAQRDEAQKIIEATTDAGDRHLVLNGAEQEAEFAAQQDLELLRPSVEDDYLRTVKNKYKNSPLAKWVLKVDAAGKKKVAPGLSQQNADAALELLTFVSGELKQKPPLDAKSLLASYSKLSADQKRALGEAARYWWRVRLAWRQADEAKKAGLREQWRGALKPDAAFWLGPLFLKL